MSDLAIIPPRPEPLTPRDSVLRLPRRALSGFGQALRSSARVAEPATVEELQSMLRRASDEGVTVTFRGAGRSYGDAALNEAGLVITLTKLNRILSWNRSSGEIDVEPGVTIQDVWQHALPDGYWPHVVPGTMAPTIGGCVAMNVHGKNHFCQGTFGDHVIEFDLVTPSGDALTCSRTNNEDIFHAAIGGLGMLGVTTRIRMTLKKVHSGNLSVTGMTVPTLDALFSQMQSREGTSDYLVGWMDAFAKGKNLGRGVIHAANYLGEGEDPKASETLREQGLPSRFLGIPRGWMWRLIKPWVNNFGMRWINRVKYVMSRLIDGRGRTFLQGHVAFAFLLDYIPRWRDTYGRDGFIQVQPFVPREHAKVVFRAILERCHEANIIPYLVVVKRHLPDTYLMSHALDGYSLAMDFKVTRESRTKVWEHARTIGDMAAEAGGRIYFAKDCVAEANQVRACYGDESLEQFTAMRRRLDPKGTLSSELTRRVLPALDEKS